MNWFIGAIYESTPNSHQSTNLRKRVSKKQQAIQALKVHGCWTKSKGKTPQIMNFNRVFHEIHHPFWGFSPYFWKHPHQNIKNPFKLNSPNIKKNNLRYNETCKRASEFHATHTHTTPTPRGKLLDLRNGISEMGWEEAVCDLDPAPSSQMSV